jgi:hypothetical protein
MVEALTALDKRETQRLELLELLRAGCYREDAASPCGQRAIPAFVEAVMALLPEFEDLRNVARNCERLFPLFPHIDHPRKLARAAERLREKFVALVRDTAKVRMSAELALKLRALYYDKIDPASVEGIIRAIYHGDCNSERALELEDIVFLVENAARLFPADPEAITGPGVRAAVWALQALLAEEREAVVAKLVSALGSSVYSDKEPPAVEALARRVARLFERGRFATKKELEEMKKLAADASQHFPPEFNQADPAEVRASFWHAVAASMG